MFLVFDKAKSKVHAIDGLAILDDRLGLSTPELVERMALEQVVVYQVPSAFKVPPPEIDLVWEVDFDSN